MKIQFKAAKLAVLLSLGCGISLVLADPMNFSYTYLEPSEGDLEDEVQQQEFKAEGSWTVLSYEEYECGLSVGGAFQVNVWESDDSRIDDIDLYKVKVPVKLSFDATEVIPVEVALVPGIHSDFEDVNQDDFRLEAVAIGTYVYDPHLTFKFGLAYGEEFGDLQVFPVGGVIWKVTPEFQADLLFPAPKLSYALSDDARFFLSGMPAGGEWNVGDNSDRQIDVRQEGYRVGLGGEYQVVEGGWLYALVGREINRSVSLALEEKTVVDEVDIDDALFVQVGFRLF